MRIHLVQHGTVDDHAEIEKWARENGCPVSKTNMLRHEALPGPEEFDCLILLGGTMDAHEEEAYPWLAGEKRFIRTSIDRGKMILGICLGSQFVAEALGSRVFKSAFKEIGWHSLRLTEAGKKSPLFCSFPERFRVFQWHDYTYDLPAGAELLAENDACPVQAFSCSGRVFGVQFHPEFTETCITALVKEYADKLVEGAYIQQKDALLAETRTGRHTLPQIHRLLTNIAAASRSNGSV